MRPLLISLVALAAVPALAQQAPSRPAPPPAAEKRIDLDLQAVPLHRALEQVLRGAHAQYSIDPAIRDTPITLRIRNVRPVAAVRLILRTANAQGAQAALFRHGDEYLITRRQAADAGAQPAVANNAGPGEERKATLSVTNVPFRKAVEMLFAGTGLRYRIDPAVPNPAVSLRAKGLPVSTLLRLLVRLADSAAPGVRWELEKDVYVIRYQSPPNRTRIPMP